MARINVIPALLESQKSSNTQEWCFSPDLESEITTLAAWCDVKQQQREPLSSSIENSEEDWSESIDEKCTSLLTSLSLDGDDADIKKDFLDRLAELLCYRKDPYLITSTGLIYNEEEVTIVGARNSPSDKETWLDKDIKMLEYLGELLERISSDGLCLFLNFKPVTSLEGY